MHRQHIIRLSYFCLLSFLIMNSGCSTETSITHKLLVTPAQSVANVVKKIMPEKNHLRNRILVFPFVDRSGLGPETAAQTTEDFVTFLKKSPQILVYSSPDLPDKLGALSPSEFGIVTDPALIKTAQDLDMNAFITGVINPVETSTKKKGIWPFRKSATIYEVSVVINVVDTFSKTLLMTRVESEDMLVPMDTDEIEHDKGFVKRFLSKILPSSVKGQDVLDGVAIPVSTMESRYDRYLIDEALHKAMPGILERQASAVVENLEGKPWRGRILSVDNGKIAINAGSEMGVKPNDKFEVFAPAKLVASGTDRSFDIIGEKIGEIETTSVMEKDSVAVPLKDGTFSAGQIITFKP